MNVSNEPLASVTHEHTIDTNNDTNTEPMTDMMTDNITHDITHDITDTTDTKVESKPLDRKEETGCQELKNIQYKTMLLKGTKGPKGIPLAETPSFSELSISNLDSYLEQERQTNSVEPWCKLNKTIKTQKFQDFVETYTQTHDLDKEESELLAEFLKNCLNRKKLLRVKDVIYDKETGNIQDIPALCYLKSSRHFTLKNTDKRVSTLKSLAGPKKGTARIV